MGDSDSQDVAMVFTLQRLESLHGEATDDVKGQFAANGMSRRRIKEVVRNPSCQCRCAVPAALLYKICCAFWCLSKSVQDALLWSLQGQARRGKAKWMIEGYLASS